MSVEKILDTARKSARHESRGTVIFTEFTSVFFHSDRMLFA